MKKNEYNLEAEKKAQEGVKFSQEKLPYYNVLIKQFPLAIEALVERSNQGHIKYIEYDGDWNNWRRVPNPLETYNNARLRHALEHGEDNKLEHLKAEFWNCAALLQLKLEQSNG
jgi:hypothetical protein